MNERAGDDMTEGIENVGTEATFKMERAIACLALELPAEVWEDVRDTWHAAKDSLATEIVQLREVLVFADGFVVSKTDQYESHTFGLADLYNETTPLQGVIQRAGCHPRGRFKAEDEGHSRRDDNTCSCGSDDFDACVQEVLRG